MRLVAIFDDSTDMTEVRRTSEPAHLAYLEAHRDEIPMAGGLRIEPGGPYVGGLWVFEVSDRQRAIELIESDPYFLGHPRTYRLLTWGKALPRYKVTL